MNIKLIHENGRWFVVVNSVAGEFREDVTAQVQSAVQTESEKAFRAELVAKIGLKLPEITSELDELVSDAETLADRMKSALGLLTVLKP